MRYDKQILKRIVKDLGVRFPVRDISRDLDYSKGVVSEYLSGKKEISDSFREKFENHYKIKFSDYMFTEREATILNGVSEKYGNIDIEDLCRYLVHNQDKLMKNPVFKNWAEKMAYKLALEILADKVKN